MIKKFTIENIKVYYTKVIINLSHKKVNTFFLKKQKWNNEYKSYIVG